MVSRGGTYWGAVWGVEVYGVIMADNFLGAWLVSEYVYEADGSFVGIVRQRRTLQQLSSGRIRVWQQCEPDNDLADHPMGGFAGEWVFELGVNGRYRYYYGPDVVGSGVQWVEGVMNGQGIWPRFGHNFTSFAWLASPERQLTGGKFFKASHMIANIVGVAVPAEVEAAWPELAPVQHPYQVASMWQGQLKRYAADGVWLGDERIRRVYDGPHWVDTTDRQTGHMVMCVEEEVGHVRLYSPDGDSAGIAKQIGPLFEWTYFIDPRRQLRCMALLDVHTGQMVALHRWFIDHVFHHIDIITLSEAL